MAQVSDVYLCICIYIYVYSYKNTYVYIYIYIHIYMHISTHTHTCLNISTHLHRNIYVYTYTSTYTSIYICIYIHIYAPGPFNSSSEAWRAVIIPSSPWSRLPDMCLANDLYIYMCVYTVYICVYTREHKLRVWPSDTRKKTRPVYYYGVATSSRLLKMIGLFCKRVL